jgi:hypothetical protein
LSSSNRQAHVYMNTWTSCIHERAVRHILLTSCETFTRVNQRISIATTYVLSSVIVRVSSSRMRSLLSNRPRPVPKHPLTCRKEKKKCWQVVFSPEFPVQKELPRAGGTFCLSENINPSCVSDR